MAGEAGGSAENTATAGPSGRLLRVQAGLIGAGLFVTDAEGVVQRATTDDPPAEIPLDPADARHRQRRHERRAALRDRRAPAGGLGADRRGTSTWSRSKDCARSGRRRRGILAIGLVALLAAALVRTWRAGCSRAGSPRRWCDSRRPPSRWPRAPSGRRSPRRAMPRPPRSLARSTACPRGSPTCTRRRRRSSATCPTRSVRRSPRSAASPRRCSTAR